MKNKAIKVCSSLRLGCTRKCSLWKWITLNWLPRPSFNTPSSMFTLFLPLSLVHSLYIAWAHLPLWVICLWIGLVFCCRANCSSFCHQLLCDNASVSGTVLKFRRHTDIPAHSRGLSVEIRAENFPFCSLNMRTTRSDAWYWLGFRPCFQSFSPVSNKSGQCSVCHSIYRRHTSC